MPQKIKLRSRKMDKLSAVIDKLVFYARKNLGLDAENEIYARNAVLDVFGSPDYAYTAQKCADSTPEKLLEELFSACEEAGISTEDEREEYADKVMGALTLSPRDINKAFARRMRVNSRAATDWSVTSGVLTSVFGRYPAGIVAIWMPLHAGTDLLIAIDVVLQSTARDPNRET